MSVELLGTKDSIIKVTFQELEEKGFPSVTDYCRDLVKNFGYQTGTLENSVIHIYRGDMLCLIVNNIKEAAKLMPGESGWRKFDKTRRKATREPRGAFKNEKG